MIDTKTETVWCDGRKGCCLPICYIDKKGYVYCRTHGIERRESQPCRKLRQHELNKILRLEQLKGY